MTKSLFVVVGAIVAVASGRVASAAPAWCKDHGFRDEAQLSDLKDPNPKRVMIGLAQATCVSSPEADSSRAAIEQSRQAWGKRFGLAEADWADVVAFAKNTDPRVEYATKDFGKFSAIDQYKAIIDGFQRGMSTFVDPVYVADMFGANLTEVGRLAYLERCLKAPTSATSSAPPAATWSLCQGDVETFDLAKFFQQVKDDTAHAADGGFRMKLRFAAYDLPARLKQHAVDVEAAKKRDPAYAKMFDIAAKARTEWSAGLGSDAKLLELVRAMESAHFFASRSLYQGCEDKTAAALAERVAKVPAKAFAKLADVRMDKYGGVASKAGPKLVADPAVYLAAIAYVLCQPESGTADFLANYMDDLPGFRGPRTLAHTRILDAKLELDDMNEHVLWPLVNRPYLRTGGALGSAGGVVASTKIDGDKVIVQLERMIVKREECIESHETNKIERIYADGRVQYEEVCDKVGIVAHDEQWSDFEIDKKFAPLLKKGVKFSSVNSPKRERGADVIMVWANGKAETPTWVLGGAVK